VEHRRLIVTLLAVMMAACIALGGGYLQVSASQGAQQDCLADFAQKLTLALSERADASRAAVLAPQRFFEVLFPALSVRPPTDSQLASMTPDERQALREHNKALLMDLVEANRAANESYARYLRVQQAHPLPPLPNQFCSADNTRGGDR
jgi:hypothetical protein